LKGDVSDADDVKRMVGEIENRYGYPASVVFFGGEPVELVLRLLLV